jgi:hypothetical protein
MDGTRSLPLFPPAGADAYPRHWDTFYRLITGQVKQFPWHSNEMCKRPAYTF